MKTDDADPECARSGVGADGSGSGCDPSAFLQIFQSVYSDVDAGIQRFSLQDLFDL